MDIAMCTDTECPDRAKCKRFTAKPAVGQNYTVSVRENGWPRCQLFILGSAPSGIRELEPTR